MAVSALLMRMAFQPPRNSSAVVTPKQTKNIMTTSRLSLVKVSMGWPMAIWTLPLCVYGVGEDRRAMYIIDTSMQWYTMGKKMAQDAIPKIMKLVQNFFVLSLEHTDKIYTCIINFGIENFSSVKYCCRPPSQHFKWQKIPNLWYMYCYSTCR